MSSSKKNIIEGSTKTNISELSSKPHNNFDQIKKINNFTKKKNEFLEYMVRDEVYFADLEKIEDYYLRNTVKSYRHVNDFEEEKEKRLTRLKQIDDQINNVINIIVNY